jgi:hypothetical protein
VKLVVIQTVRLKPLRADRGDYPAGVLRRLAQRGECDFGGQGSLLEELTPLCCRGNDAPDWWESMSTLGRTQAASFWCILLLYRTFVAAAGESGKKSAESGYRIMAGAVKMASTIFPSHIGVFHDHT